MASVEHQTYAYDGLRRLTSVTAQAGNAIAAIVRSKNFSYDLEGNVHTIDSLVLTLVCAGAKTRPVYRWHHGAGRNPMGGGRFALGQAYINR